MKSPYRKGIQITVSNAALQAAAITIGGVYRTVDSSTAKRIVDFATLLIDEIERRAQDEPAVDPMLETIAIPSAA